MFIGGNMVVGGSGGSGGTGGVGVVVGVVVVVVTLLRRFGLNLLRRSSRSACIFWSCVRGGAGTLIDGGVGGVAGFVVVIPSHSIVVGVLSGVGEGGMHGSAHSDPLADIVVGVLSGVGKGGMHGSAHRDLAGSGVVGRIAAYGHGVFSGDGEGGGAGSAHSDDWLLSGGGDDGVASTVRGDVKVGGVCVVVSEVVGEAVAGACRCASSACIASAKNLLRPSVSLVSLSALRLSRPLYTASGSCCCGMKSASELCPSSSLSTIKLPLSSLNRASAASALPWCTSQCSRRGWLLLLLLGL